MASILAAKRWTSVQFDELLKHVRAGLPAKYSASLPRGTHLHIGLSDSPRAYLDVEDYSSGVCGRMVMNDLAQDEWHKLPAFTMDYLRTPAEVAQAVCQELLPAAERVLEEQAATVLAAMAAEERAKQAFVQLMAQADAKNVDPYWDEYMPDIRTHYDEWARFEQHSLLRRSRTGEVALMARHLDNETASKLIAVLLEAKQPVTQ